MAAPKTVEFDAWLGQKLTSLNPEVDLDVFVEYIKGILETETEEEDVVESMTGILSEITEESEIVNQCKIIYEEWKRIIGNEAEKQKNAPKENLEDTMHNIIEQQTKQVVVTKKAPVKSAEHKAAILAQYSQVSDGEEEENEVVEEEAGAMMGKNMNAIAIGQREKENRDRAKQESEQKKLKDKEDREKQKQKTQDRKESEKKRTAKGERRR